MRNIFDQYRHPENRITHALATVLHEDRALLHEFVRWVSAPPPPQKAELVVLEQQVAGDHVVLDEESAMERGLPDTWIHDDDSWCVLIETKVAAPVLPGQIRRHFQTARRRGFEQVTVVVLVAAAPRSGVRADASPPLDGRLSMVDLPLAAILVGSPSRRISGSRRNPSSRRTNT